MKEKDYCLQGKQEVSFNSKGRRMQMNGVCISVVNPVAEAALILPTYFYIAANKEHLTKIQIIFIFVNSAFSQLYSLKFSFKLANISRSCEESQTVQSV